MPLSLLLLPLSLPSAPALDTSSVVSYPILVGMVSSFSQLPVTTVLELGVDRDQVLPAILSSPSLHCDNKPFLKKNTTALWDPRGTVRQRPRARADLCLSCS